MILVHENNQCEVRRDELRKEYVCKDRRTNEGYRTSNLETALDWCRWSISERNEHYRAMARVLYDVMEGKEL